MEKSNNSSEINLIFKYAFKDLSRNYKKITSIIITLFISLFILSAIFTIEDSLKNEPVELTKINKKNYLRIITSGQIDFDNQIYLYHLNENGKPGFEVINPIKIIT